MNLDADDARCVIGHFRSRLADGLRHLAEDVQPSLVGLIQCLLHDLTGDPIYLDVHLQRGDTVSGACHLEVHITQVVLVAHDVGQHHVLVAFLDKPHGNTGNGRFDGHAGVHQRHAGAANAGHRARSVGFGDFRYDTDNIGKLVGQIRHQRHQIVDAAKGKTHGAGGESRIAPRFFPGRTLEHENIHAMFAGRMGGGECGIGCDRRRRFAEAVIGQGRVFS